eukprot:1177493-Prorocentrum_minimum.AAC.4
MVVRLRVPKLSRPLIPPLGHACALVYSPPALEAAAPIDHTLRTAALLRRLVVEPRRSRHVRLHPPPAGSGKPCSPFTYCTP